MLLKKSIVIQNGFNFERIEKFEASETIRSKFNINSEFVVGMVATFYELKDYTTYIKGTLDVLEYAGYSCDSGHPVLL
ncbi:MAG: hypothetical protein KAT68_07010 [Bacteroidales bacterium]|nr:hypothetical protein [Bacteroidales bacterium]